MTMPADAQTAAAGKVVLAAQDVNVIRGSKSLLDGVSLELHAGEVLALIGPNGAGKSTLLSVLSGDVMPEQGKVEFLGREIDEWPLLELARRRSVLLQDNQITFPFTVLQVVEMGRAPWRRTPASEHDNEAISTALTDADVSHLGSRRVPSLSGGERARVGLARVLAGKTGVLMLDEPTAALDLGHQEAVLQLVRQRANQGDAVLVVLHDLNLAAAYADRIVLLQQGRVVEVGAPDDVLTAETVSRVYGTPVEVIERPGAANIVVPLR